MTEARSIPEAEPEFSRRVSLRQIDGRPFALQANKEERTALAKRFAISSIDRLDADLTLERDGDVVSANGRLRAEILQACAISGEDFPVRVDEPVSIRFVPRATCQAVEESPEEIELAADQLDEVEYDGDAFDLGEAVAQSLALAIDPYAEGPTADAAREQAGLKSDDAPSGPLAEALAGLKRS